MRDVPSPLIGHPVRADRHGRAVAQPRRRLQRGAARTFGVLDIFRYAQRIDPAHLALIGALERTRPAGGIRIFHVNGDEVERVIAAFEAARRRFRRRLQRHRSRLGAADLSEAMGVAAARASTRSGRSRLHRRKPGHGGHQQPPGRPGGGDRAGPCCCRGALFRHSRIGVRAAALLRPVLLRRRARTQRRCWRCSSRMRREDAVPRCAARAEGEERSSATRALGRRAAAGPRRVKVIATPLDTLATRSLINACDCFVSLHRAEGFGRGLGEAMALGRLAMGTGWSGNVDFMTAENSLLVDHDADRRCRPMPTRTGRARAGPTPTSIMRWRCCGRCWTTPRAGGRSRHAGGRRCCAASATAPSACASWPACRRSWPKARNSSRRRSPGPPARQAGRSQAGRAPAPARRAGLSPIYQRRQPP